MGTRRGKAQKENIFDENSRTVKKGKMDLAYSPAET